MTASTPFSRYPVPYQGQRPATNPTWDTRRHRLWLGKPGNMVELPSPDPQNSTAIQSRGESEQGLGSGISGMVRLPHTVGRWTYSWHRLAGYERSRIDGFYRGMFGAGPFCLVPPEDPNRLTLAQSMCGGRKGVVEGWVSTGPPPVYDGTLTAPIQPCGVMRWTPSATNQLLVAGQLASGVAVADPLYSAPYVPAEPFCVALWVRGDTGSTSVALSLAGRKADGTVIADVAGATTMVPATGWTRVYAVVDPGDLAGSDFVVPVLKSIDGGSVQIANALTGYRDFPPDWAGGSGVPRVTIAPDGRGTRALDVHMVETGATMTFADAIAGRA